MLSLVAAAGLSASAAAVWPDGSAVDAWFERPEGLTLTIQTFGACTVKRELVSCCGRVIFDIISRWRDLWSSSETST